VLFFRILQAKKLSLAATLSATQWKLPSYGNIKKLSYF